LDCFLEVTMDWLSRLFEMMPVRGRLDLRCSYGAIRADGDEPTDQPRSAREGDAPA
jgi:hypothetical protein